MSKTAPRVSIPIAHGCERIAQVLPMLKCTYICASLKGVCHVIFSNSV